MFDDLTVDVIYGTIYMLFHGEGDKLHTILDHGAMRLAWISRSSPFHKYQAIYWLLGLYFESCCFNCIPYNLVLPGGISTITVSN